MPFPCVVAYDPVTEVKESWLPVSVLRSKFFSLRDREDLCAANHIPGKCNENPATAT